jgi:hypothetical protein
VANWANVGVPVIIKHVWPGECDYDWQRMGPNLSPAVDWGRDLLDKTHHGHPGRKTMQQWAQVIAAEIRTKRLA